MPRAVVPVAVRPARDDAAVRLMFAIWLAVLASGIVVFSIIGLSHH